MYAIRSYYVNAMPEVQSAGGSLMQKLLYLLAAALVTLLLQLSPGLLGPPGIMLNLLAPLPAALVCMLLGRNNFV